MIDVSGNYETLRYSELIRLLEVNSFEKFSGYTHEFNHSLLLANTVLCYASDGYVSFQGRIIEVPCKIQVLQAVTIQCMKTKDIRLNKVESSTNTFIKVSTQNISQNAKIITIQYN